MRLFTFLSVIIIISSCTVEKRLFRHGWHVEWKHRNNVAAHAPTADTILYSQETSKNTIPETTSLQVTDPEISSGIRTEETTPELTGTILTDLPEDKAPVISSSVAEDRLLSAAKNEPQPNEGEPKPSKSMKWKEMDSPIKAIWIMNLLYGIGLPILFVIGIATSHAVAEVAVGLALFLFLIVLITTLVLSTVALKRKKQFPERYNAFTIRRAVIGGVLLSVGSVILMFFAAIYIILADATSHW